MPSKTEHAIHLSNRKIRNDHYKTTNAIHLSNRKVRNDHYNLTNSIHLSNRKIRNTNWDPLNAKGAARSAVGFFQSLSGSNSGGGGGGPSGGSNPDSASGTGLWTGGGASGSTANPSDKPAGVLDSLFNTSGEDGEQKNKLIIPIAILACVVGGYFLMKKQINFNITLM